MIKILFFLTFVIVAIADQDRYLLPISGFVGGLPGYHTLTWQAIRYEPVCGAFGPSAAYAEPMNGGNADCIAAMDVYRDNNDTMALYSRDGIRLRDIRVGGGTEVCMCFSLTGKNGGFGDFCVYVGEQGMALVNSRVLSLSYRPNGQKTLPECGDVDLQAASASWSATAFMPAITERTSIVGNGLTTMTKYQTVVHTDTFTPSGMMTELFALACEDETDCFPSCGYSNINHSDLN
jgi:hypothetical protein